MCGINGIWGIPQGEEQRELISRMNHALRHRGPDDQGIFQTGILCLGHRRLSVIEPGSMGVQPMKGPGAVIVFNGEIYNYRQLRSQLGDYPFVTTGDTETILAAYKKWGAGCLNHLRGMFSFAIWDVEKEELFIARDRMGIKPLYYYQKNGVFLFSSEIRSLLASGLVARKLNKEVLGEYIRFQTVHAPDTIIRDVKVLMPGHYLVMKSGKLETACWWDLVENAAEIPDKESRENICRNIREILRSSVEEHLVSDVPTGVFLSGGIDSSAITGIISRDLGKKMDTFSVTFEDSRFNEGSYASAIAGKFNTSHHELLLKPSELSGSIPEALKSIDHPGGDGINTWIVSKMVREKGIKVALSGLGGDELFGGYDIFKRAVFLEKLKFLNLFPLGLRSMAGEAAFRLSPSPATEKIKQILQSGIGFEKAYPLNRQVLDPARVAKFISGDLDEGSKVEQILNEAFSGRKDLPLLSRVSVAEICTYLQNVLLRDADQMSMAHGLELRVPFLDHRLVEYLLGVNDVVKYPHSPKKLLIDSLQGLLPGEVVNRSKMGFLFPWTHWMKNELREFCESRLQRLSAYGCFSKEETTLLWNQFLKGDRTVTWSRVWHLVVLSDWLNENGITE